jgi:hypothetical protein
LILRNRGKKIGGTAAIFITNKRFKRSDIPGQRFDNGLESKLTALTGKNRFFRRMK